MTTMARRVPKIGDERYLIEIMTNASVEALARKNGWKGGEGVREYCEPEDTAVYWERKTLDDAIKAARDFLDTGNAFYGCAIIDREVFEVWQDDRGNTVKGASWERKESWEVARDGEAIKVER